MNEEIKKKIGRPTNYLPEYCEKLEEHFNKPLYKEMEIETGSGFNKKTKTIYKPESLPTFEGFCVKYRLSDKVVYDWKKKHPEFLQSWERCKKIQKQFLIEHGLMNNYNSNFAKFVALNLTDLKDDKNVEVTTPKDNPFQFNIVKTDND